MKLVLATALLTTLVAVALSAPQQGAAPAIPIVKSAFDDKGDGSYSFSYESADGTKRDESGTQKKIGEDYGATKQGSVSWKTPDGKTVTITFVSDENGFQPKVTIS